MAYLLATTLWPKLPKVFDLVIAMIKEAVKSQVEKSNVPLAILFFLSPTLLWIAFLALFGFRINGQGLAVSTALGAVSWVISSAVIYLVLVIVKGKAAKGKFVGVLSAFSCVYIVSAIAGLLVFGLLFLSMPGLFEKISSLQNSFFTIIRMVQ